jgi:hypothetical protein
MIAEVKQFSQTLRMGIKKFIDLGDLLQYSETIGSETRWKISTCPFLFQSKTVKQTTAYLQTDRASEQGPCRLLNITKYV